MIASEHDWAWARLSLTPGLGLKRIAYLRTKGIDPVALLSQPLSLPLPSAIEKAVAKSYTQAVEQKLHKLQKWLAESELHHLLTPASPFWPELLNEIPDAPAFLLFAGNLEILSQLSIAIVGSRTPLPACEQFAFEAAQQLAKHSYVVTSGLARGIDAAAHRGALTGGRTLAVMPAGPDLIYPPEHQQLLEQIKVQGGVLYEHIPGTGLTRGQFAQRNRLVAALSQASVIIQASENSGSMITARLSLEYNRELMVPLMPFWMREAEGSHQLVKDGAMPLSTTRDILELLNLSTDTQIPERILPLLDALSHGGKSLFELSKITGIEVTNLKTEMLELEFEGKIKRLTGERYALV